MPLTASELVLRATRKARAGLAPSVSKIYDDSGYLLIKDAMHELAMRIGSNSEKRSLLMSSFTITFTNGIASLAAASFDVLLKSHLRYAYLYDPSDTLQKFPYQFRHHLPDLKRALNIAFGYWTLPDKSTIATRQRNVAGDPALTGLNGSSVLRAIYLPDFSGSNPLPAEFEDLAVEILAELLTANRTPTNANTT